MSPLDEHSNPDPGPPDPNAEPFDAPHPPQPPPLPPVETGPQAGHYRTPPPNQHTPVYPHGYPPPPRPPSGPRLWTAFVVPAVAFVAMLTVSSVSFFLVLFGGAAVFDERINVSPGNEAAMMDQFARYAGTVLGFAVTIVPTQIVVGAAAVGAAMLSPETWTKRLSIRPGSVPSIYILMPFLLGGTVAVQFVSEAIATFMSEHIYQSDHLDLIAKMMMAPKGWGVVATGLMISVLPGICEELLFRGYMLRRLLQIWHPIFAILLTSALFALYHFDPIHAVAVFPIGLWLGIMTWRTGTVWPAVICHTFNNAMAMVMIQFADPVRMELNLPSEIQIALYAIGGIGMPIAIVLLALHQRPAEPPKTDPHACGQCGYPRYGVSSPICPECGFVSEVAG